MAPETRGHGRRRIPVGQLAAPIRLDLYLADRLELSRSRVQRWIRDGLVRIGDRPVPASTRVSGGEQIEVQVPPPPTEPAPAPEDAELSVLYSDADLIVVDKPAGLTVHPGAGREAGTLANRLLHHFASVAGVGHPQRPGIVHRLDRDTTGVVVVAANQRAYEMLSRDFAERRVEKTYLALVHGAVRDELEIEAPIARHPRDRKRMATGPPGSGRPARTTARPIERVAEERLTALAVRLHTGRTHQIRVHMKHAGHPLIGDPVYGEARWKELTGAHRERVRGFARPALHAWSIAFRHPSREEWLRFAAPIPADLVELWTGLGGRDLGALAPPGNEPE